MVGPLNTMGQFYHRCVQLSPRLKLKLSFRLGQGLICVLPSMRHTGPLIYTISILWRFLFRLWACYAWQWHTVHHFKLLQDVCCQDWLTCADWRCVKQQSNQPSSEQSLNVTKQTEHRKHNWANQGLTSGCKSLFKERERLFCSDRYTRYLISNTLMYINHVSQSQKRWKTK